MKVLVVIILATILQVKASVTFAQKINLNEKNVTLSSIIKKIGLQSGYDFVYNEDLIDDYKNLQVKVVNVTVEEALKQSLKGVALTYTIDNKLVVIKRKMSPVNQYNLAVADSVITGRVIDATTKQAIPGVNVSNKNRKGAVQTAMDGSFRINGEKGSVILFSYVGYKPKEIVVGSAGTPLVVSMEEAVNEMKGLVVNGIFTRKAETATGSQTTVTKEKLLEAGTVNIIQSLRNIDPSFAVIDNSVLGSNPNALPDINLRGQSGIPDLNGNFATNPNLPLFILDGFETTLQRVVDLDMYRVSSVTLLKDAASKAIYGAKAANGVVVIETLRPVAGKIRVNYNTNVGFDMPDLSSYNLANASQKLDAEVLAGVYTSINANEQHTLTTYF